MINDVIVVPLKQIPDERGSIMHMLREDSQYFEKFGEIYFSTVYPGVVKGWHKHTLMTLNYAVVFGMIKLVLFDDRDSSSSKGEIMEIFLGESNYSLVKIPPGIWNGFKGIGGSKSIVANCSTHPHDSSEIIRLDPFKNDIPYSWDLSQK